MNEDQNINVPTNRPLSNEELELKISKLETVISALGDYLLTSQPQEDELKKLFSCLEVLLSGALYDAVNAGHTEGCIFVERIISGIETVTSVSISKIDKKLTE